MAKYSIFSAAPLTGILLLAACGQKGPLYYDDGGHYDIQEEYYYAFPGYYPIGYYYPECEDHHCENNENRGEGHPGGLGTEGGFHGGGGGHR